MTTGTQKEINELRARRRALRLTQADLASRAKVSQGLLSRVERGERTLSRKVAFRIRLALYRAEQDATRIDPLDIGIPLGDLLAIYRETEAAR